MAQSVMKNNTCVLFFSFESRSDVSAIHNAETREAGQEVLMSVSELVT